MQRAQVYDDVISGERTGASRRPVVQARALATRARIIDQAAVAFARDGYDAASLTGDILEPAGVSVGSFYHQFDNKLDVLFALLTERQQTLVDDLEQVRIASDSLDLAGRVTALLTHMLDHLDRQPELYLIQLRERWNPDPQVRAAVFDGWAPWRQTLDHVADGLLDDTSKRAAAMRMLGTVVVPTLGLYLDAGDAGRQSWREDQLAETVTFCVGGLQALAAT